MILFIFLLLVGRHRAQLNWVTQNTITLLSKNGDKRRRLKLAMLVYLVYCLNPVNFFRRTELWAHPELLQFCVIWRALLFLKDPVTFPLPFFHWMTMDDGVSRDKNAQNEIVSTLKWLLFTKSNSNVVLILFIIGRGQEQRISSLSVGLRKSYRALGWCERQVISITMFVFNFTFSIFSTELTSMEGDPETEDSAWTSGSPCVSHPHL